MYKLKWQKSVVSCLDQHSPKPSFRRIVTYNGYLLLFDFLRKSIFKKKITTHVPLGEWIPAGTIPEMRFDAQIVIIYDNVYVIGGTKLDLNTLSGIYRAKISSNGDVDKWRLHADGPVIKAGSRALEVNGYLCILGGYQSNRAHSRDVYTMALNIDGTLHSKYVSSKLPNGVMDPVCTVAYNRDLYVIGGVMDPVRNKCDPVIKAKIDSANSSIVGFKSHHNLNTNLNVQLHVTDNNCLYLAGSNMGNKHLMSVQHCLDGGLGIPRQLGDLPCDYLEDMACGDGYLFILGTKVNVGDYDAHACELMLYATKSP